MGNINQKKIIGVSSVLSIVFFTYFFLKKDMDSFIIRLENISKSISQNGAVNQTDVINRTNQLAEVLPALVERKKNYRVNPKIRENCINCESIDLKEIRAEVAKFITHYVFGGRFYPTKAYQCKKCNMIFTEISYTDDQMERFLKERIPFEAPEPVVKEEAPPKKKVNKRNAPAKARSSIKTVEKVSDTPLLPNLKHQPCAEFKVDERDVQYGIILIGNYLKKKYLDPTAVALGFEVGELSWTRLKQIIQSRLGHQLRLRRGFLLHCINWVQLRNDTAHPIVKIDETLFTDLEAVRSKLGNHTNAIQGVLERLVGPKKPGACKPEPLEKGRPFENPIPILSAIRLVEAIVNRCFGTLFKDLQEEPTLAKLSEIVVDPQDVGLSKNEFEAIKALWTFRNGLAHTVKTHKVMTSYVMNLFQGHSSFELFLGLIFKK